METTSYLMPKSTTGKPFQFHVKRYQFSQYNQACGQPGTILILIHGNGFPKETWEPFLEELGTLQSQGSRRPQVQEAWAFDCPNHGESSALNEQYLVKKNQEVTLEDYTRSGLALLKSGLIPDLDKRRIILIGHSVGTCAAVWLTHFAQQDDNSCSFDGCFLIEPPGELFKKPPLKRQKSALFIEPTKARPDVFLSEEVARQWFKKNRPYKTWDDRALDAYLKYGLRPLPTAWNPATNGLTLSLPISQELYAYSATHELNKVLEILPSVQKKVPIHVFVSERSFLKPSDDQCKVIEETPGMSLSRLPAKSDHLCVQDIPKAVAESVLNAVDKLQATASVGNARL